MRFTKLPTAGLGLVCALALALGLACSAESGPREPRPSSLERARREIFERFPVPAESLLREHDHLLRRARALEALSREHPREPQLWSDLLSTYVALLAHEARSDFAGEVCNVASRLLGVVGEALAARSPDERNFVEGIRKRLHWYARQYPLAHGAGADIDALLEALGQGRHALQRSFEIGSLRARVYATLTGATEPELIWDSLFVDVGRPDSELPHHHVTYTLGRRGQAPDHRWYLRFHALNRTEVLRLYGETKPTWPDLRRDIETHVRDSLSAREGR